LLDGSRVRRESHARFCERLAVKFPGLLTSSSPASLSSSDDFEIGSRIKRISRLDAIGLLDAVAKILSVKTVLLLGVAR
jgi:hypothetical protein